MFKRKFSRDFKVAWKESLPIWLTLGRANDYPRSVLKSIYAPSRETALAQSFVKVFADELVLLFNELGQNTQIDIIVFDLIDLSDASFHFSDEVLGLEYPIPPEILLEIESLIDYDDFTGKTIGDFFSYEKALVFR